MPRFSVPSRLAALAAGFLFACSSTTPEPDVTAPAPAESVSPSFDVQAVIRRVTRTFHSESGRFSSMQGTYAVQVAPEGTVRFAARQAALSAEALVLRTASLARGGQALTSAVRTTVREDGALALDRGAVVEVLENADGGLAQRWELAGKPRGAGDLEVRVVVAGLAYAGETAGGQHFTDPATGLGVRYGQATWVDARGVETAVRTEYTEGALRLVVPEAVLESSTWPARLAPLLSPEIRPDTPVFAPTSLNEAAPVTAHAEGTLLVVWDVLVGTQRDIVGTRVRASDGAVLDPTGIVLASSSVEEHQPTVAAQGGVFLVAWRQLNGGIYRTRVRASTGQVLDAAPVKFSISGSTAHSPAAACGTDVCAVVWGESSGILSARVRLSDGVVLGTSTLSTKAMAAQGDLAVAADESQFLVAWSVTVGTGTRNQDIQGVRFRAASGLILDSSPLLISTAADIQNAPAIAFTSGHFLVVWSDTRLTTSTGLYGSRVRASDGAVLDPSGLLIASSSDKPAEVAVGTDGTQFLVAWQSMVGSLYELHARRVTTAGAVVEPSPVVLAKSSTSGAYSPALAFDGTHYLLAWMRRESSDASQNIYGARVRPSDLGLLEPAGTLLSAQANRQSSPVVAWGGGKYLVAWLDSRQRASGEDLYGVRLGVDGQPLDTTAIPLSTTAAVKTSPQVVSDGADFLVAWNVGSSIQGARVRGADGVVLDPTALPISGTQSLIGAPRLAFGGGHYFVAWTDQRVTNDTNVYGVRLRPSDGQVLDASALLVSGASGTQNSPAVAFGAGSFFVTWLDARAGRNEIYGARIRAADGEVLDPAGLAISTGSTYRTDPVVASDGTRFLVAWRDQRTGTGDFYGSRVEAATGQVLDPAGLALLLEPSLQNVSSLLFDGRNYLLVWSDTRSGSVRLNGLRLKPEGTALDGTGFLIAPGVSFSTPPPAAASGPGRYLFAAAPTDTVTRTQRVVLWRGVIVPDGEACAGAAECESGQCVEGVCCATACEGGTCGSGTCEYPPPGITCPSDVVAEATSAAGARVDYPPATATGRPPLAVTYSQASGTDFPLGPTSVTATVTDGAGETRSCAFAVTVSDTTAPTLVCPAAREVEATGLDGALVTYPSATASDAVSAVTLEATPPSGSRFPVGTTDVSVRATDAAGNTSTCQFPVTVTLPPEPQVTCPSDVVAEATDADGALVTYPPATGSGTEPLTVTSRPASGSRFALGLTAATATARDGLGREASCGFFVTVEDTTPPTLVCPESLTVDATSTAGALVTYPPATATDAVSPVSIGYVPSSGTHFNVGTTRVRAVARDLAGNLSECAFTVTVRLPPAPEVTCPADVVAEANAPRSATVEYPPATATGTEPLVLFYTQDSGTRFPLGTSPVSAGVRDGLGREDTCAFTVTVRDTTAPVLTCPADVEVRDAPEGGVSVDYPAATATDLGSEPVLAYSHPAGAHFPVGTTRVTVTATDEAGHASTCDFQVRVAPREAPPVVVPEPKPEPTPEAGCGCGAGMGTPAGLGWMALLVLLSRSATRRRDVSG
ncbi:HYR domain-containing protein [Archangium primigenium]|uniref:HYR domain-containing protein n=1 Tax=[Archangium] primigenium TaxID=2792470 RepID=UPI00195DA103|nr:HYR domain-containing protein [Archangium primigenium]MBM7113002.1 HYR domain-containing protein [Archangium primigenium]